MAHDEESEKQWQKMFHRNGQGGEGLAVGLTVVTGPRNAWNARRGFFIRFLINRGNAETRKRREKSFFIEQKETKGAKNTFYDYGLAGLSLRSELGALRFLLFKIMVRFDSPQRWK
ncbi:hypothetical protein OH491_20695 [Termitidicoccus mucosus]|uniref:Uncharacterized protein n=1 Tax=Termitidicoccus mucosus TaxID=1184151 RepID=A0A178ICU9_9BACT|nr:hypothetical protein AW736_23020 [Opitutaceae bacterium TSB47]